MPSTDVVVGAGLAGPTAARELTATGRDVVVLTDRAQQLRPAERRHRGQAEGPADVPRRPKVTSCSWADRYWYTGTCRWWDSTTDHRANVPGANTGTG
jgi:choline dehydrogenase-like flavoprotein